MLTGLPRNAGSLLIYVEYVGKGRCLVLGLGKFILNILSIS